MPNSGQQNLRLRKIKTMPFPRNIIWRIQRLEGNSIHVDIEDLVEVAHNEPLRYFLCCFQILLYFFIDTYRVKHASFFFNCHLAYTWTSCILAFDLQAFICLSTYVIGFLAGLFLSFMSSEKNVCFSTLI